MHGWRVPAPETKVGLCGVLGPLLEDHRTMPAAQAASVPLAGEIPLDRQLAQIGVKRIIDGEIEVSPYTGGADW
jgi:hypothetical protein